MRNFVGRASRELKGRLAGRRGHTSRALSSIGIGRAMSTEQRYPAKLELKGSKRLVRPDVFAAVNCEANQMPKVVWVPPSPQVQDSREH